MGIPEIANLMDDNNKIRRPRNSRSIRFILIVSMIYFVGVLWDKLEANNMTLEGGVGLLVFLSAFIFSGLYQSKIIEVDINYLLLMVKPIG